MTLPRFWTLWTAFGLLLLLAGSGCDWITTMGPQPRNLEGSSYEARLNVFGVLRPASAEGVSLSFVHVEYAYPTSAIPDSATVVDADVRVYSLEAGDAVDSVRFAYTRPDSVFETYAYRGFDFQPSAGETYRISCGREAYPTVTATTMMPAVPVIREGSLRIDEGRLRFEILRDSSAVVYDLSFRVGDALFLQRVRRPEAGDTIVDLAFFTGGETQGDLVIYAYDANLSAYVAYNISIKPNTYRTDYSTVENGYGCLGSMNLAERVVVF